MPRPSKEWVDECLAVIESDADKLPPGCSVLAAEVRALRAELDEAQLYDARRQESHDYLVHRTLKDHDRLVLVAALPDTWRACASTVNDPTSPSIFVECAEELERVLNDDDAEAYRAEVDKLRGDEQDAWARLGAELCEAETERDRLREELAAIATNWRKLHALEDCITTRAMLSCAIELEKKFSLPK